MATELERWALIERQYLAEEMRWLKAGAKWLSPSGDDITAKKLTQVAARLEHVNLALEGKAFGSETTS